MSASASTGRRGIFALRGGGAARARTAPHVRHRESFYALEGEYEFLLEGSALMKGKGHSSTFPGGRLHSHRTDGEDVGRMLVGQTPGGLHERFFEEIREEAEDRFTPPACKATPDMERIDGIVAEYGIEMPYSGRLYNRREETPE